MDFKTLIQQHNKKLEQQVEENAFLNQRIKARLQSSTATRYPLMMGLRKRVLLYSLLFLLLTLLNFTVIGLVKKPLTASPPVHIARADAFRPDAPGNIYQAYLEVIKWEN